MTTLSRMGAALAVVVLGLLSAAAPTAGADVLTGRYNNFRTGAVTDSISAGAMIRDWGFVGGMHVEGRVLAQPLYVDGVRTGSGSRKAVFVATEHNIVYGFDADTLQPLWPEVRLGTGPEAARPNQRDKVTYGSGCDGISPDGIGIEATPVIDRAAAKMYVSYRINPQRRKNTASQRLAAVDIGTGKVVTDVELTGVEFNPNFVRSRTSLLEIDGVLYIGFASRCEESRQARYGGWVFAVDARNLRQLGAYRTSSNGAGIWQASSGIASDGTDLYFLTGNQQYMDRDHPPAADTAISDAFVRLHPSRATVGGIDRVNFDLVDWFIPYRRIWLDATDLDLGSAGPVLIPDGHHIIGGGKQGWLYVLDSNNMGKLDGQNKWDASRVDNKNLPEDATADQFPENLRADHVVQKFRAAFNQYIPDNPFYLTRPGAPVAAALQAGSQLDVFHAGRDGALYVTWNGGGIWSNGAAGVPYPTRITSPIAPAGASVVAAPQGDHQLDAFVAGNDGALHVTWVVDLGQWSDGTPGRPSPAPITPTDFAPPGAPLAAAKQGDHQLDVFVVGDDGAVWVTWAVGPGHWSDGTPGNSEPARITPTGIAPKAACLAAAHQGDNQLDVFFIGNDGAVYVTWVAGEGHWSDGSPGFPSPVRITRANFAKPGGCLATAMQSNSQLDVFGVGNDGAVFVTWVVGLGHWSDGTPGFPSPALITPLKIASPGAVVAAASQSGSQLDVFFTDGDGSARVTWVTGLGHWSDGTPGNPAPAYVTPKGLAPAGAAVTAAHQTADRLDVFVTATTGAINVSWVVGLGHWTDGSANNLSPLPLSRAVWMRYWLNWPHIHGTPVLAKFGDDLTLAYVWPEKDHLKSFRWVGDRFDEESRLLATDCRGGAPSLAPDGMPGGMLSAAVDSGQPHSGVVFASLSRDWRSDGSGILRAYDAISLHEVWNNEGDHYHFAKFVPPTIANGRVYLATASGEVRVYGPRRGANSPCAH